MTETHDYAILDNKLISEYPELIFSNYNDLNILSENNNYVYYANYKFIVDFKNKFIIKIIDE